MLVNKLDCLKIRKGEELKAPRHASVAASCDDHVTTHNIIPNRNKFASAFSDVFVAAFDCGSVQAFKLLKFKVKCEGIKR